MKGYIKDIDWMNIEPMKYWSAPASTPDGIKKEMVRNAIFSGEYLGALKVDGYYQRLIKDDDGNCFMIARNRNTKGEVVDKYAWVPQIHKWMDSLPNGTCLLAEAYLPNQEGSKNVTCILGCLKDKAIDRQKTTPLHFHIFDCMAFNGANFKDTPYATRAQYVQKLSEKYQNDFVHYAKFYEGEALWEHLQAYLAQGREGMVIMQKDAVVYTKRTPARVSIKVKQELRESIDCVIIGANPPTRLYNGKYLETWPYWENERTGEKINSPLAPNGFSECYIKAHYDGEPLAPISKMYYLGGAGSLKCGLVKDGQIEYFCDVSGIEEEILINWKDYVHKVCEISGMMLSKDIAGNISVRHPRFMGFRDDKTAADCRWEQVG